MLKALTHNFFSIGIGLYLALRVEGRPVLDSILVIWLAVATNAVIDGLGHWTRDGAPVRSYRTHSVFTAPLWGMTVASTSFYLLDASTGGTTTLGRLSWGLGLGVVMAYSHLLLDAPTEGGVFFGRRRMAIAHFRYDNGLLNAAFAGLGAALAAVALF
ncbi:MAG: DUF1286 domain-containing protein [Thaumarchaeota archaeon]|nr:DUF1286 domain-containing protein [Nitrososphaerota archaeon]